MKTGSFHAFVSGSWRFMMGRVWNGVNGGFEARRHRFHAFARAERANSRLGM